MRERFQTKVDIHSEEVRPVLNALLAALAKSEVGAVDHSPAGMETAKIIAHAVVEVSQNLGLQPCDFEMLSGQGGYLNVCMGMWPSHLNHAPLIRINPPYFMQLHDALAHGSEVRKGYNAWRMRSSIAHEYEHEAVSKHKSGSRSPFASTPKKLATEEYAADMLAAQYIRERSESTLQRELGRKLALLERLVKVKIRAARKSNIALSA